MNHPSDHQLTEGLIHLLQQQQGRARSLRAILTSLGLSQTMKRRARRILKALMQEGRVIAEGRDRYRMADKLHEMEATLLSFKRGLVVVEGLDGTQLSVRIRREERQGALLGDRVRLQLTRQGKGLSDGRIEEILVRGRKPLVGIYHLGSRGARVIFDDPDMGEGIQVDESEHVEASEGDWVIVEVDELTPRAYPRGRVVRVLGEPGQLAAERDRLVFEHHLEKDFPAEVQREVELLPADPYMDRRVDLRSLPLVTIDPPDAKDFDDAVWVERQGDQYRLLVSIADVSAYVRHGKACDQEAFKRGCSAYLPGTVYPMLPPELSEGLCSLAPGVDRATVTVEMLVDSTGTITASKIYRSMMRSAARLCYQEVQQVLDGLPVRSELLPLRPLLEPLSACARLLLERLKRRGMLDLDLPESDIQLDEKGIPIEVKPAVRHFSCRIIEACMIHANETVGRWLLQAGVPAVYRVHPVPDPERIENFSKLAKACGIQVRWKQSPAPKQVSEMLGSLKGLPAQPALNQLLLRSLMPAYYSAKCDGHYGLSSSCYLHFTSPIRRYADLVVHRQLGSLLDLAGTDGLCSKKAPPRVGSAALPVSFVAQAAQSASISEGNAQDLERRATALYHAAYLKSRIGEEFDGVISFVSDFGIFVRLQPSGIEGLVHVSNLKDDYYVYQPDHLTLTGRSTRRVLRMGMPVRVRLESVDLALRQIRLELMQD